MVHQANPSMPLSARKSSTAAPENFFISFQQHVMSQSMISLPVPLEPTSIFSLLESETRAVARRWVVHLQNAKCRWRLLDLRC